MEIATRLRSELRRPKAIATAVSVDTAIFEISRSAVEEQERGLQLEVIVRRIQASRSDCSMKSVKEEKRQRREDRQKKRASPMMQGDLFSSDSKIWTVRWDIHPLYWVKSTSKLVVASLLAGSSYTADVPGRSNEDVRSE